LHKKDSIDKLLFDLDKEKIITEVEAQYQNEKKEKEIALQKEKIAKNELQIKNNRLTISLMLMGLLGLTSILFAYYKRQSFINKQIKKEMRLKSELQAIETENEIQKERLRISRDLHDNIGSQLTFVTSSIDNLNFKNKGQNTEIESRLNEISLFTKNTISELRDTIWALNQSEINLDTIELRIQSFIEKARMADSHIQIEFISKDKNDVVLNSLKGINILRFVQEGVNNAMKHADATHISVQIFVEEDHWEIKINDNGKGFDLSEISYGFGLENMQKRIAESGGTLHITSEKGKGTQLKAYL
jgi:signal transduction histidine kinase